MKIKKPLSSCEIAAAKPADKVYRLFDGGGLFLEVLPTGGKSWRIKYKMDGREDRVTLGKYPAMNLQEARNKRQEVKKLIAQGINPKSHYKELEAQKKAAAERKLQTFEKVAREFLAKQNWVKSYQSKIESQFERCAYPAFGQKLIAEVTRQDILDVARAIEKLGAAESSRRFIQRTGQVLRYGMDAGYNQYDVTVGLVRAIAKPVEKHRSFLRDKVRIGQFLRAIDAYGGYPQTRAALALAPMLVLRPGELVKLRWPEVDFTAREIHIPPERMKMRRKHIVPLATQALEILEALKVFTGNGDYLFPSPKNANKPLWVDALRVAIRAMGFTPEELHTHGLRAMFSTILNERGFNRDWIEIQLSHGENDKIRAAYNHAEWLPQRHKMMQEWADYLDELRA